MIFVHTSTTVALCCTISVPTNSLLLTLLLHCEALVCPAMAVAPSG